jgi:NADP-dependent 3-hydroxy acid dehydrogenase YdfG
MTSVAGRVAFITGGVSGIGLGIAKALGAAGARLVITYRREEHLQQALLELKKTPGIEIHPIRLDVCDREQFAAAATEAVAVFGKIHILCNSAGVNLLGPMDTASAGDWDWIMSTNVDGVINALLAVVPKIKSHGEGGHVINVGSMSSFIVGPLSGIYAASKYAVRGLTESLRYSLAPHRIAVSLVCPGLTKSNIFEGPAHVPDRFSGQITPISADTVDRWKAVQALGMDADEVGLKTLQAVLHNDFYVFTHPEFKKEVQELAEEMLACFTDEAGDPKRLEIERKRQQAKRAAQLIVDRLQASV